eukprot:g4272.t1
MGPHGTFHVVGEKLGSNEDGRERCSDGGSAEIPGQLLPLPSRGAGSSTITCNSARRNKVYDNIMRQWEKASSSMVPMPRSSHRRVLGGQALPTRQRGESFSLETSGSGVRPSWGNLSDTVSPAVQLAWREQLLQLKLSRLAGVPMTVLLRQKDVRGPGGGATEACRVVAASQDLSAKPTALAVIEGTCVEVSLNAPPELSMPAAGSAEGFRRSGGGIDCGAAEQRPQPQYHHDSVAEKCQDLEEKVVEGGPRERAMCDRSCGSASAASMNCSSSSSSSGGRGRIPPRPLRSEPPVRGFHLVDLHAVVRNSVEWRQCLPKVEPCFRVSSNRDGVLLGLVHALGGRLSCSSAHDINAGVGAARRASPVPAPPPRLLDRHVCRSPALLRASVAAGVQVYEVDSADEWFRINAARRRKELSDGVRLKNEAVGWAEPHPPQATGLGPASVVVRLAMPFRSTRQSPDGAAAASTVAEFAEAVEASYGAREEDVVEIVEAAMAATIGSGRGKGETTSMPTTSSFSSNSCSNVVISNRNSSNSLPIVGFSIDVGSACWDDAFAEHAATPPPSGRRDPDASCATPDAAADATPSAPGEAAPSTSLAESIDAAVAFAVKMAGVAAAAARRVADGKASEWGEKEAREVTNGKRASKSATTAAATATTKSVSPLTLSASPFSFRRLHVTGLGEGGARAEPLAALKAALSRHLPPTVATAVMATSGDSDYGGGVRDERASRPSVTVSRPVVVSADATEHLVAGGVWSTVASIIGRKSVPPAAIDDSGSPQTQSATTDGVIGGGAGSHGASGIGAEACGAAGEEMGEGATSRAGASSGGTMYYIDDGCYGSLSGALLRGVQMQPLPLRAKTPLPLCSRDSVTSPAAAVAAAGETSPRLLDGDRSGEPSQEVPCTVWGPTCDGLDCVCRMTPLPDDMEPGRDWLFFPDVGIRGGADATDFNGLKPLDLGHNVTFGTHNCLRTVVEETPGVAFLSAGRMPMHDHHLRSKLRSLSQAGGFWGLLTLLNDVYLPLARPMYRALLSAVQPSPPSQSPSPSSSSSSSAPPNNGAAQSGEKETTNEKTSKSGVAAEVDTGQPPPVHGDGSCCAVSESGGSSSSSSSCSSSCGGGNGGGVACVEEGSRDRSCSVGNAAAVGGAAEMGGGVCGHGGASSFAGFSSPSSCGRPFDLVVLDMGSLGGLDFAQKLGIPYMFNSPSLLFDLSGRYVTATLPAWGTGMPRRMSLGDRLQNAISPRALSVFLTPAFIAMNKARREHGLEPFYAQDNVFHGARVLVNTAFGFEYPHRVAPLVEMTGPLLPPRVARALSAAAVPPPLTRSPVGVLPEDRDANSIDSDATGSGGRQSGEGREGSGDFDEDDPLALPFLIRTWLGGTGALVAPGTAAFEAAAKQAVSAKQRAEAAAAAAVVSGKEEAGGDEGPLLPDDNGVIYVNLGRMPQLDKWQLVTILQALSSPSEAMCWGGGGAEDRLGPYRVLWVLPPEQREQLLSALLPMAPPPSFRLKILGGLPHLGILAHPAVKAVVSHCGMGVAQEALVFGKPILCLPMLADQEDIARRVVDAGVGLGLSGLPTGNISSGDIRDAVADIVSDPSFRGSAAVLSGVLRRAGGTLRAADVVEGTLQLGGSSYLHPPELRGPWHETSSTDAYVFLVAGVILVAVLGYALLAAICYGVILFLRLAARTVVRSIRWLLRLHRHIPRIVGGSATWWCWWWWGRSPPDPNGGSNGSVSGGSCRPGSAEKVLLSPEKAAAAAAAAASKMAVAGGGGLWDEALVTLLGGPGPPDPFPEDSLPELDEPAIDRQSAPGVGGRNGRNSGGSGGGGGGGGNGRSGVAAGGVGGSNGHLRSLSGEIVMWPTAPNDGRTFDFRGWSNGAGNGSNGGGYGNGNGNEVSPHQMKRWD